MAYNLPPGWDPGFVLPENVRDEGLERRAFVTKQLPRGTYDNPSVGTGGYAVPQYVLDEEYGQGTLTTKWRPSGTYDGGKIPDWLSRRPQVARTQVMPGGGRAVTMRAMGDAAGMTPITAYGQRAAQGIIARVSTLPRGHRESAIRAVLDKLDPTLWKRTQEIWKSLVKQRVSPGPAFEQALARAMSAGMMAEIIQTGLRRSAPQAQSLLGLGCYGCAAALGADETCQTTPGFSWIYGATVNGQFVSGHWERTPKGGTDVPYCPSGPPAGAVTVETTPATVRTHGPDFYVGPFGFYTHDPGPVGQGTLILNRKLTDRVWALGTGSNAANRAKPADITFLTPAAIAGDVAQWLTARLREETDANGNIDVPAHYTDKSEAYGFPEPDAAAWFSALGIEGTTPVRLHTLWKLRTGIAPFAKSMNPMTKQDAVLHVILEPLNYFKERDPKSNPLVLKVWFSSVPDRSIWGALWNPMILINPLEAAKAIASVADGIGHYLADLVCGTLNDPGGRAGASSAASAAAAAYGLPPQAGAEGVAIAADHCAPVDHPKPPPPPPPPSKSLLVPLLVAGGAVAAAVLVTQRKRKAP